MNLDGLARLNAAFDGRYRVDSELGRGGMAIVYQAEDLKHGRTVAIKVLRPELTEDLGEERFSREIEVAARLAHPNILGLHDSGVAAGFRYFVMPFVEGESLRDLVDREGKVDRDRAIGWAREIAEALAYAHEHDLVHRDVKPENVLLQAGHAIVCDFGIAKTLRETKQETLTRKGTSVGTFAYMSPEQLSDDGDIDPRTDVYALGCLLYEMLEGEPPFAASKPQAAMARKLAGELPAKSSRPDVPLSVWDVVLKALEPDPEDRFTTAGAMASALTVATTDMAVRRSRRRRSRGLIVRLLVGAAAIFAIAWIGSWAGTRVTAPNYDRIGVMPLANGAGDPDEEFYVRGVHEDLVEEMQRAGLRVLNPSATRRLAGTGMSMGEIASQLEADALVEGSVERIGPRVVVDVRLVDGGTAEIVWSDSYTGDQVDIVTVLREVTLDLTEHTGARLSPEAVAVLEASTSIDPVLYELLLQGRYEVFKLTPESLDQAENLYARAVARDSSSREAWQGLAGTWTFRAQQGLVPGDVARARRDSILALAPVRDLAPEQQAVQLVWPNWKQARWGEAEELFLQALEERPGDAQTRAYYAQLLLYLGRVDEALREGERAARQTPEDPLVQGLWAQILNALHRFDEAEDALLRASRFEPDAPYLLSTLRTTYHLQGRDSLAIESWRDSYRVAGDLEALAALERGHVAGGYSEALRSVAELFEDRRAAGAPVSEWQIGTLYTRAGDVDRAIEYLSLALDEGDPNSLSIAVDAIFDPLRDDARFQALVDQLQLPR